MSLNQYTKGEIKNTLSPKLAPFSKISLMLVVIINSSKAAPLFKAVTLKLFAVAITMLILAASGFVFGITAAKILKQKQAETVSLAFGSGMRNISAGAVIAAQYFPAEVLFPVMICTVFQQILAALTGFILRKIEEKSHQVV
jgi:predicted Na+-dependent transporter